MPSADDYRQLVSAIRRGDVEALRRLVAAQPDLATTRLGGIATERTPLHVVTDWPGYFPNGPRVAQLLVDAGAPVDSRADGEEGETPLHWTASSDDVDVAAVLVDAGANVEMPGGSIGTPLDNAVGYACWHVARLLVARGARVDALWHAGALGMLDRLEELLASGDRTPEEISQAFWHACAGGQRRAGEILLDHGADLNWTPEYASGTPLDAAGGGATRQGILVEWLESRGARRAEPTGTDAGTATGEPLPESDPGERPPQAAGLPEQVARRAFAALAAGDAASVLELVDEDLEWTFLDPSAADPRPGVCRGRHELAKRIGRGPWTNATELEELVADGDRVLVVTRSPGIDEARARKTGDLNFHVLTVREGRIVALRACRSRQEAAAALSET